MNLSEVDISAFLISGTSGPSEDKSMRNSKWSCVRRERFEFKMRFRVEKDRSTCAVSIGRSSKRVKMVHKTGKKVVLSSEEIKAKNSSWDLKISVDLRNIFHSWFKSSKESEKRSQISERSGESSFCLLATSCSNVARHENLSENLVLIVETTFVRYVLTEFSTERTSATGIFLIKTPSVVHFSTIFATSTFISSIEISLIAAIESWTRESEWCRSEELVCNAALSFARMGNTRASVQNAKWYYRGNTYL